MMREYRFCIVSRGFFKLKYINSKQRDFYLLTSGSASLTKVDEVFKLILLPDGIYSDKTTIILSLI